MPAGKAGLSRGAEGCAHFRSRPIGLDHPLARVADRTTPMACAAAVASSPTPSMHPINPKE
jgi:hypothetical protein